MSNINKDPDYFWNNIQKLTDLNNDLKKENLIATQSNERLSIYINDLIKNPMDDAIKQNDTINAYKNQQADNSSINNKNNNKYLENLWRIHLIEIGEQFGYMSGVTPNFKYGSCRLTNDKFECGYVENDSKTQNNKRLLCGGHWYKTNFNIKD